MSLPGAESPIMVMRSICDRRSPNWDIAPARERKRKFLWRSIEPKLEAIFQDSKWVQPIVKQTQCMANLQVCNLKAKQGLTLSVIKWHSETIQDNGKLDSGRFWDRTFNMRTLKKEAVCILY